MKQITTGIVAHVDAGKTTLSESLLYLAGSIRKMGRVDTKDAFLDTDAQERARGITIFSKQAGLVWDDTKITLLDTPGHVDFSAEMERVLAVLDYAILVVSGADGVQGHTRTLWELLEHYNVPVFLFINKMDQPGTDRTRLMTELKSQVDGACVDFTGVMPGENLREAINENSDGDKRVVCSEAATEDIAACDESVMECYFENGYVTGHQIRKLVWDRKLFPCFFGSALKLTGVEEFLQGFTCFAMNKIYPTEFGARIFKISRDPQGNRLTHMKITGGTLKARDVLSNRRSDILSGKRDDIFSGKHSDVVLADAKRIGEAYAGAVHVGRAEEEIWQEKVNQIRIYNGDRFETVQEVSAGEICTVTGLTRTWSGQGLGFESETGAPALEPVLSRQIVLPEGMDVGLMLPKLRMMEEEQPELHIVWDERAQEIRVQVMGEVQIEILSSLIADRFGVQVTFGPAHIVYRETILQPVEGVGHFEPLRHYAEVHLLMEPLPPGSGLVFAADCSEDLLDKNWQRLILTHLEEKTHRGVLTGSAITDMKITVIAGRAHPKHTAGGDFRRATYRAVRQGLMEAESRLLEPFYNFRLEIPEQTVGRAMTDIEKMNGRFDPPEIAGDHCVLTGYAPVATMQDYKQKVSAYTRGFGRLFFSLRGYEACHNEEEVIAKIGYDPEADVANSPDSVFCAHGSGFIVPWYEVKEHMHVESPLTDRPAALQKEADAARRQARTVSDVWLGTDEVDAILEQATHANRGKSSARRKGVVKRTRRGAAEAVTKTFGEMKASAVETHGEETNLTMTGLDHRKSVALSKNAARKDKPKERFLLVDGYNIIFAWDELHDLANANMDAARGRLLDELCSYQAMNRMHLIVVFDAYRVAGHQTEVMDYHNIQVVYTREAETADQYIEKFAHVNAKNCDVTVATSDGLEQVIIRGEGCHLLSANDLKDEVERTRRQIRETYMGKDQQKGSGAFRKAVEEVMGRKPAK
ncbi:MAG: TetM/TetW/TetO/TetS family tetracycline resistance ribosomal protection protein [Lachnospiraceae bacterium]|nr:TetM/TetW/TetO/TetS family tetracycline resistance ribosomal protection protein [Lachnospiraceae bacterium]